MKTNRTSHADVDVASERDRAGVVRLGLSRTESGILAAVMSGIAAALAVLTLFRKGWVESVFGVDPDHHNGSYEWLIVAGLIGLAVSLSAFARSEFQRAASDAS